MSRRFTFIALFVCTTVSWAGATAPADNTAEIARGRYLVQIGGCNECHTNGYAVAGGQLPVAQWLKGSPQAYTGPWGTTYAPDLRAALAPLTEGQWLSVARLPRRPPMPWTSLQSMSDEDLRAVYRFVRSLDAQR